MKLVGEHNQLTIDCNKYVLIITDSKTSLVICGYQKNILDWRGRAPSFRIEKENKVVRGPIFNVLEILQRKRKGNYTVRHVKAALRKKFGGINVKDL